MKNAGDWPLPSTRQSAWCDAFGTVDVFGCVWSDFCRLELESTFFRGRDVTFEFPIPGTPSGQLHLSQRDAIHPLHRVVEVEIRGGFHWPCLCVWLRRCHSKLYPLPLFQTAGSVAFQQNDDSSSYISAGWSKGVLAWNPKFYHRDKMAAGRGFV